MREARVSRFKMKVAVTSVAGVEMGESRQDAGYALEAELISLDRLDVERWGMVGKINGMFFRENNSTFSYTSPSSLPVT